MWALQILVLLAAFVPVGFLAATLLRAERLPRLTEVAKAILPIVGAFVLISSFGEVPAGTRGVVLRFSGVTGQQLDEGPYFVWPIISSVELMDVQVQATPIQAPAASRDLQDVSTTVTLNWRVDPSQAARVSAPPT